MGEGGYISITNIVIMRVVMYPSPYVEDDTGADENEPFGARRNLDRARSDHSPGDDGRIAGF